MSVRAYYTGTLRTAGHYFWINSCKSVLHSEDILKEIPDFIDVWAEMWDGGLLKNSETPDRYNGNVIAIPAKGPWTAFCWWDRSVDSRPGSNSGFYVFGFDWEDRLHALKFACDKWPEVIQRQRQTLVIV